MSLRWVLFDLNGTLLDPAGIGDPWGEPTLGEAVLQEAVRSAMADTLSGVFRPFDEHVRAAVARQAAVRGFDSDRVDAAAQRASALDPYPDAGQALATVRAAGHRVAVVTNSGREAGERALASAGLEVEAVVGTDEVGAYKPDRRVYQHALRRLGATDAWLVAAHAWDVTGAKRAGLRTAWVARLEGELSPVAEPPDVQAADNPHNPNPETPKRVLWGEQSFDEMGAVALSMQTLQKEDEPVLQRAMAARVQTAIARASANGTLKRFLEGQARGGGAR